MRNLRTEAEIIATWKSDSNNPVVSICCTTYNHESYVENAIEGFLIQETDFPFEILIRDDFSTDKTAKIVKQYVERYPQLIKPILEKENTFSKGVKPLLQLYKIAKGEYIAICEGDDYWTDPLKLQKQGDFLEKNDEYVITYTSVEAFDNNGIIENYIGGTTLDLTREMLQRATPINTLTSCFRNVIIEMPKEFECTKYGDLFMWSLLGAYGKGKFLADILPSRYRMHDGGVHSSKTKEEQLEMYSLTCAALYLYHSRVNNKELAYYFQCRILKTAIGACGLPSVFKYSLKFFLLSQLLRIKILIRSNW